MHDFFQNNHNEYSSIYLTTHNSSYDYPREILDIVTTEQLDMSKNLALWSATQISQRDVVEIDLNLCI